MIKCLKCHEVDGIQKAGFNRGRQRFRCRHCDYYFNIPIAEKLTVKPNHQTTIKDLARELGVSPSTISKALHNHPDISQVTRKAIIDLAQKMDYYPNQLAYNLVKSKSRTIGIVVPVFFSTFFPSIINGAQEVLSAAGYNLLICQSNEDYNLEKKNIDTLLASRVEGLLVSVSRETNNYDHLLNASKRGIEIVMFNRINKDLGFSTVGVDDYNGAFNAVEHLIQQGYKRIAHLAGPQNLQIGKERLRGYKDALLRNNLPILEDLIIPYDLTEEKARIYSNHLLNMKEIPDALFAINDPTAITFLLVAQERGVKIPQEVGVIGFSYDPISAFIPPGLSTVSQPTHQIGREAATILLSRLQGKDSNMEVEHKVLQTELIIRGSTKRPSN